MSRPRSSRPLLALFVGLALMVAAWAAATPLGSAADEPAHYVKALAAGHGHAHGAPPELTNIHALEALIRERRSLPDRAARTRALDFVAEASGAFALPRALVPERSCFHNFFKRADTAVPADCVTIPVPGRGSEAGFSTYVAAYPPYVYLLPGVAMRAAGDDHADAAFWLGRAAFVVLSLALIGLALLLLWDAEAGPLSLVGLMVATTPMSLWSFSVLNTSGLEIAGATCWTAGLIRLARGRTVPPWAWGATAAGGAVLATARPSGPFFLVLAPLCVAIVFGLSRLRTARRGDSRRAAVAALVVCVALAAALFWQRYMPSYSIGFDTVRDSVSPALDGLPETLREAVGRFAGDYFVPVALAAAWAVVLAGLVVAAARRQPRVLLLVAISIVAVAAYATAYLTSGFDEYYGRYALPALLIVPLCAGAALVERREHGARLALAFALATGAIQLLVWWLEARRLAVGTDGPFWFLGDASWSPPGGWPVWAIAMLVGTALYVSSAVTRPRPTP